VLATGADILVTECSGCQMQLAEAMARAGSRMEVISTPEALARFDPACRAAALSRGASED
jgi:Fe-S oxidoreductase